MSGIVTQAGMFGGRRGGFDPLSLDPLIWLSDTGSDPSDWPNLGVGAITAVGVNSPEIITDGLNGRQVRRLNGTSSGYNFGDVGLLLANTTTFVVQRSTKAQYGMFGNASNGAVGWISQISTSHPQFNSGSPAYRVNGASSGWVTRNDVYNSLHLTPSVVTAEGFNYSQYTPSVRLGMRQSFYYGGDIGEVIIIGGAISTEDRSNIEQYLGDKWGISIA